MLLSFTLPAQATLGRHDRAFACGELITYRDLNPLVVFVFHGHMLLPHWLQKGNCCITVAIVTHTQPPCRP
jgi:hypothetical protein